MHRFIVPLLVCQLTIAGEYARQAQLVRDVADEYRRQAAKLVQPPMVESPPVVEPKPVQKQWWNPYTQPRRDPKTGRIIKGK